MGFFWSAFYCERTKQLDMYLKKVTFSAEPLSVLDSAVNDPCKHCKHVKMCSVNSSM